MMTWMIASLCLLIGFLLGFLLRFFYAKVRLTSIEQKAIRTEKESAIQAEIKKNEIIYAGRELIAREKQELEKEVKSSRSEIQSLEKRLQTKEENLEKKQTDVENYKQTLNEMENALKIRANEISERESEIDREKERIAGLTKEEVKQELVQEMHDAARASAYNLVKKIEEEAHLEGEKRARAIVIESMQSIASECSSGTRVVSSVSLPSEEMKGRIIGKEGRNIRALEVLTGADIIIDDTPDAVVVSSFDPVRREIAKRSLETLIGDGRIHPTRIEEVVQKVTKDIKKTIMEEGEKAAMEVGFNAMSPAMLRAIGRLYFRFSYSQNILIHSKECAHLAAVIAGELGADIELAKRAAFLHDIGKGADAESDEGHATFGAKIARDLGENEAVVNAIASHHGDVPAKTQEALIVQIADAISGSRPGARNDTYDNYINRLQALENIANSFEGVEKSFAIQAGREIRVLVNCAKVSDDKGHEIAEDIARRVEAELNYPGQIKVTLIRETRFTEYAK